MDGLSYDVLRYAVPADAQEPAPPAMPVKTPREIVVDRLKTHLSPFLALHDKHGPIVLMEYLVDGRRRIVPISMARRSACHFLCGEMGWSASKAGRFLGLDHSTVLHHLGRPDPLKVWSIDGIPPVRIRPGTRFRTLENYAPHRFGKTHATA